jgi:hypothetical protein
MRRFLQDTRLLFAFLAGFFTGMNFGALTIYAAMGGFQSGSDRLTADLLHKMQNPTLLPDIDRPRLQLQNYYPIVEKCSISNETRLILLQLRGVSE